MKFAFTLLALLLNAPVMLAYNTENHSLITRRAIMLLEKRFGENYLTQEQKVALVKGNVSEDEVGLKWLTRPWNQHFFNPLKPKELRVRGKAIDVRFERITKRCIAYAHDPKFFFLVGEVLHHIQDATNPAHVVPVYHGGRKKDKFDEQPLEDYLPAAIALNPTAAFAAPYTGSLLQPVALQTLESIKRPFAIQVLRDGETSTKTIDWSYFWKDNPDGWFGSYGEIGKPERKGGLKPLADNYLNERIIKASTVYVIKKELYADYTARQLELAVLHTANFIHFAKQLALQ